MTTFSPVPGITLSSLVAKARLRGLAILVGCCALLALPVVSVAAAGDCGQPVSKGSSPTASDAQTILKSAVGQPTVCDDKPCICDTNGDGKVSIDDALRHLRYVVGIICPLSAGESIFACGLHCNCPTFSLACTSASITALAGSDLDVGWTGLAHDSGTLVGTSMTVRVKRECSGATPNVECQRDEDCAGNGHCQATCDCAVDKSCEISGPTGVKHCRNTLVDCESNRCIVGGSTTATACLSNADCGNGTCTGSAACNIGVACVSMPGPPLPLASAGTPVCVVPMFEGPLTGTAHAGTGEAQVSATITARVHLGNAGLDKPCPVCGPRDANPEPGDVFTCDGGQFPGAACTVDGVSATFGGTSFDCPPQASAVSSNLALRFHEVTTGTSTRTAQLPCAHFGVRSNPTLPINTCLSGSEPGMACTAHTDCDGGGICNLPVCTDTKTACVSNADCTRCTLDADVVCAGNADCVGNGSCAQAPDQPVTCGFWCHCGLCGGDPFLPCFGDADCPVAKPSCEAGPGIQATAPQSHPNQCTNDQRVCGGETTERCESTLVGTCSNLGYRTCETNADCDQFDAGICVIEERQCFEPRITRSGAPSPFGVYCAFEDKTCSTNADCAEAGDFCVQSSARPRTVALLCAPTSFSQAINKAAGIMGPVAMSMNSFVEICYCGDQRLGCDEECDDGNVERGDGCDDFCQDEMLP